MIIHKRRFKDEDDKRIVPDGGRVRVSISAMDNAPRLRFDTDKPRIRANQPAVKDRGRQDAMDHRAKMMDMLRDPNLNQRLRDRIESSLTTLDQMQRDANRAQAFADHFTEQREARADNSAYGKLCARLQGAYMEAAA